MPDRLTKERLEQVRRSLAMSPSLPAPVAEEMLAEVHRLRSQLVAIVDEVDGVMAALRSIQRKAAQQL